MSIQSIKKRILEESEDKAKEKLAIAEEQKSKILQEASDKIENIKVDMDAKAKKEANLVVERRKSTTNLEKRKLVLSAKNDVIEDVFKEAKKTIINMDKKEYIDLLMKKLEKINAKDGELMLNKKDYDSLKSDLEEHLKNKGVNLSSKIVNIDGGFILKQGNIYFNASIEEFLNSEKKELIADVVKELFVK